MNIKDITPMKIASAGTNEVNIYVGRAIVMSLLLSIAPALVITAADYLKFYIDTKTLNLEERKAAAELYRNALASPDAKQRKLMVDFLDKSNLVPKNSAASLSEQQIPQWPVTECPSVTE